MANIILIFDFLFGPDKSPEERIFNTVMSAATIVGIAVTIFAIIMWIKDHRLLKKMAKDQVNKVVAEEIRKHLGDNFNLEEIKAAVQKEIWKNKEVHVEEIKTESTKELSQQRIIKISVEDKNEPTGFRSFFVKITPTWLIDFIHERRQATYKRKKKK